MNEDTRIIRNAAECRQCGDTIESTHVHDYVTCGCGAISVDGGRAYLKRSGDPHDALERSEYEQHGKRAIAFVKP